VIEIIHVTADMWYVVRDGIPYGPYSTERDAQAYAEYLRGKCKDCGA
jgi:hypothetical protein